MLPDVTAWITVGADPAVKVYVERFDGTAATNRSPAVVLLSAAEAPSSRWPNEFIERLVSTTGPVIRFDTRDSGRSDAVGPGYSLDDLAADAVSVLDHFDVQQAHVIGRSMGGMIGQLLALNFTERVRSLVLLSTSAGPSDEHGPPEPWIVERMSERLFGGAPATREERISWIVDQQAWFAGNRFGFDRDAITDRTAREVDLFWHAEPGHGMAVVNAPERYDRLGEICCPTLVVHGTTDPVYPVTHGQALAEGIPDSHVHLVEDLGHELPVAFAEQLGDVVERFLSEAPFMDTGEGTSSLA